jgi:hypothetical protein
MSCLINPYVFSVADLSVVLLCHFDGSDASTTFTDEKGHALTAFGNAQLDTAQFKWGSASGLFDGSGDRVGAATSNDCSFGSGETTGPLDLAISLLSFLLGSLLSQETKHSFLTIATTRTTVHGIFEN